MRYKSYRASQEVIDKARAMGIEGETLSRLSRMARRSAVFTHELGNRRFFDYLLELEGDEILSIHRMDPDTLDALD